MDQIKVMKETGPVWDDVTQQKLPKFDEALDKIGRTWSSIVTDIKAGVGSILGSLSELGNADKVDFSQMSPDKRVKMEMAIDRNLSGLSFPCLSGTPDRVDLGGSDLQSPAAGPAALKKYMRVQLTRYAADSLNFQEPMVHLRSFDSGRIRRMAVCAADVDSGRDTAGDRGPSADRRLDQRNCRRRQHHQTQSTTERRKR